MILGSYSFFKCNTCGEVLSIQDLVSGNTFSSKFYSDGKFIAPMQRKPPEISICYKCNNIFWLKNKINERKVNTAFPARFLILSGYIYSIDNKIYSSRKEEIYLRKRILWEFNDRIRNNEILLKSEVENEIWTYNIQRLINLLDFDNNELPILNRMKYQMKRSYFKLIKRVSNYALFSTYVARMESLLMEEKLLLMELYRYQKKFEISLKILETIDDPKMDWLVDPVKVEILNKNSKVFQLY